MRSKVIKIGLTLLLGGLFLWLAFRNVRLQEVWEFARNIQFGWLLPFAVVTFLSHVVRAERWRLLIEHEKEELDLFALISAVMVGYMTNLVAPRVGEVARPVYAAKREGLSSSKLIGTIVLERIIDITTMGVLMAVVAVYLVSDVALLSQIFGEETVRFFSEGLNMAEWLWGLLFLLLFLAGGYLSWKLITWLGDRYENIQYWIDRARQGLLMFKEGILSARKVQRWGYFLVLTALIWLGYTLMSYIPFWMFDLQETYQLGFLDALTITVISAIGISIPSPGGIGTYHYFVKQTLIVLFAVPAVTSLAYATITHAAMVLIVSTSTPVILAIDKYRASRDPEIPIVEEELDRTP
ncbi:MAG: lysylphosphatidylglycerol synthase transmembrane domain-containing protein [Balneolaceae bacterium]|nr:lysylphosphatidylglycerol synthase transmembrane domain-containing protein [Balneolaceae bacterium]